MQRYFHDLSDIPPHETRIGQLQMLSGEQGTFFYVKARAGSEVGRHSHPMEQMTWLISGKMEMEVGDAPRREILPGTIVLVPPNVEHRAWYVEDCVVAEFAAPPRHDMFPQAARHPYGIES